MWHKAIWNGHPMRLELTRVGLLVELANHYTTRGAWTFYVRFTYPYHGYVTLAIFETTQLWANKWLIWNGIISLRLQFLKRFRFRQMIALLVRKQIISDTFIKNTYKLLTLKSYMYNSLTVCKQTKSDS